MVELEFLTVKEFSERLRVGRKEVYRWIDSGRIKAIRVSDKDKSPYRIPAAEIRRLQEQAYEDGYEREE